jgi:hypothetical protein
VEVIERERERVRGKHRYIGHRRKNELERGEGKIRTRINRGEEVEAQETDVRQ